MPTPRKRSYNDYSSTATSKKQTNKCPSDGTYAPLKKSFQNNLKKKNQSSTNVKGKSYENLLEDYHSSISAHKEALELLDIRNCDYSTGRENEVKILQGKIETLLMKKCGGFIHISGLSGVGKTCVVNHVSQLICENPKYTSILNNKTIKVKCTNHGNKILENLNDLFKDSKPRKKPSISKLFRDQAEQLKTTFKELEKLQICVLDELDFLNSSGAKRLDILDQKNNKHNDFIKAILDCSRSTESKVIILAISNSVNLIDIKALNGNNIVFPPYKEEELSKIISHKLAPLKERVSLIFEENSPELINRRVSNHNGDVRYCLSIFRKAVETGLSILNERERKLMLESKDLTCNSLTEKDNKDPQSLEQSDLKHNLQSFNTIDHLKKASFTEKVLESPSSTDIPSIWSQETDTSYNDHNRSDPYSGSYNSCCSQSSDEFSQIDMLDRTTLDDFNETTESPQERRENLVVNTPTEIKEEPSNLSQESDQTSQLSTCIDFEVLHSTFENQSKVYDENKDISHYPLNDENFDSNSQISRNIQSNYDSTSQACNDTHEFGTESSPDNSSQEQSIYWRNNSNIIDPSESSQIAFITDSPAFSRIGVAALNRTTIPNNYQHIEYLINIIRNLTVMKAFYLKAVFKSAIAKSTSEKSTHPGKSTDTLSTHLEINMEDAYKCYIDLTESAAPVVKMTGSSFQHALEEFADAGFLSIKQPEIKQNKGRYSNINGFQRNHLNCIGSSRGLKIVISLSISVINSLISILNIDLDKVDLRQHFAYGLEN